jgi:glycosyltransferase involved in cell wall biosynthesis
MARVTMFLQQPLDHDTRVEKEAATLSAAGYEVVVIAASRADLPREELRGDVRIVRVDEDPLPSRLIRRLVARRTSGAAGAPGTVITRESVDRGGVRSSLLRRALRLHLRLSSRRWSANAVRAAADQRAALWIAHDLETLPTALRARRELGGSVIYDSHEFFTDSPLTRGAAKHWERIERRHIGQADAVMTVSAGIARLLAERYGITEPVVLMNVPQAPTAAVGAPVDLRAQLGLPGDARVVLYLGGIQQLRGLDVMIRAIAERDDLALVMMGPGSPGYRDELTALATQLGVAGRIGFLPPVPPPEIRRFALGADVGVVMHQGVSLSYRHALPNKLFDYLHAGLPVVVSDLPEVGAVVTGNRVGATCDPADPASIAAAIDRVTADPELRRNVEAAAPRYTWEREAEKLLALAASMTSSNRAASVGQA